MKYRVQFRHEDFSPLNELGDTLLEYDADTIDDAVAQGPEGVTHIVLERQEDGSYINSGIRDGNSIPNAK